MSWWLRIPVLGLILALSGCGPSGDAPATVDVEVPMPDLTGMESQVADRFRELARKIEDEPLSSQAWGTFGMVAHAHRLYEEAEDAYSKARELDGSEERWAYYLGDVLSVLGTDLEAAEDAFRAFIAKRPNYAPGHMRLGNVLVARNLPDQAAETFKRALTLSPELQPARVALAQIQLAKGDLEGARTQLETVLKAAPRHGQALSTLSQVYQRLGQVDEARKTAARASDPAAYNLYDDPLFGEVVAEERSSVLLWERAKSFLEHGNYQQAALGLTQVLALTPDNAEAHLQLAAAYGHLGRNPEALPHLIEAVRLDQQSVDARIRLGAFHLESGTPGAAITPLAEATRLEPDNTQAHALLAQAHLRSGDPAKAIQLFESIADAEDLSAAMHNDWGNALAQTGEREAAATHFRAALDLFPGDPQAHFFLGLLQEAGGRLRLAQQHYCASAKTDPRSPAAARLAQLQLTCP